MSRHHPDPEWRCAAIGSSETSDVVQHPCLPNPDWRCPCCSGRAFCPDGLRFKKKIWFLGHYSNQQSGVKLDVALRLDRNTAIPCLELLFLETLESAYERQDATQGIEPRFILLNKRQGECKTVGYLLLEVGQGRVESTEFFLRGWHISPHYRGAGLSHIMISSFLRLCHSMGVGTKESVEKGGAVVATRKIDKPVLSLVLLKFGFKPQRDNVYVYVVKTLPQKRDGTIEERSPPNLEAVFETTGTEAKPGGVKPVVIWTDNPAQTRSVFALSYLKTQNMVLLEPDQYPDKPEQSEKAYVNTPFSLSAEKLEAFIDEAESRVHGSLEVGGFCGECFRDNIKQVLEAWHKKNAEIAAREKEKRAGAPEATGRRKMGKEKKGKERQGADQNGKKTSHAVSVTGSDGGRPTENTLARLMEQITEVQRAKEAELAGLDRLHNKLQNLRQLPQFAGKPDSVQVIHCMPGHVQSIRRSLVNAAYDGSLTNAFSMTEPIAGRMVEPMIGCRAEPIAEPTVTPTHLHQVGSRNHIDHDRVVACMALEGAHQSGALLTGNGVASESVSASEVVRCPQTKVAQALHTWGSTYTTTMGNLETAVVHPMQFAEPLAAQTVS